MPHIEPEFHKNFVYVAKVVLNILNLMKVITLLRLNTLTERIISTIHVHWKDDTVFQDHKDAKNTNDSEDIEDTHYGTENTEVDEYSRNSEDTDDSQGTEDTG